MSVQVFQVTDPSVLDWPEMIDLFERAFEDPKFHMDGNAVRESLKADIVYPGEMIQLWVARTAAHGLCGLVILALMTSALSPFPQVVHFFADAPSARHELTSACFKMLRERGVEMVSIHNASGASDRAYMRMFRRFAKGEVAASLIFYRLEDEHGRGY